jgi:hypothetical protein
VLLVNEAGLDRALPNSDRVSLASSSSPADPATRLIFCSLIHSLTDPTIADNTIATDYFGVNMTAIVVESQFFLTTVVVLQ